MDKIQIAVYGSLRKGEYNYDTFKNRFKDGYNYLRTTSILGYDVYSLGPYPGLKQAEDPNSRVVVDIMECSKECFDRIELMELDAGYETVMVTEEGTNNQYPAYLYVGYINSSRLVKSGDWVKRYEEVETV